MDEYTYTLYPKLVHLTLSGQNEEGELEWIGTNEQWNEAVKLEIMMSN